MSSNQMKISMSQYYDMPNRNLLAYLKRQQSGNPVVYETTLFPHQNGADRFNVVDAWREKLVAANIEVPGLLDYEIEMSAKVGPMSYQKPLDDRMDSVETYYDAPVVGEPIQEEALTQFFQYWGNVRSLPMWSLDECLDDMKMSTNSGAPYFTKRRNVADKLLPSRITYHGGSEFFVQMPEWSGYLSAILGWRGQEGGPTVEDVKQRDLWMFPQIANLFEAQVYKPVIKFAQEHKLVQPWQPSQESVYMYMTKLFDTKEKGDPVICTDFTKFDQHFGKPMQDAVATVLSRMFRQGPELEDWLTNIFPLPFNIPLLIRENRILSGFHGMGSGAEATSPAETLGHTCLQHAAALEGGARLNPHSMCLGDDGCLTYPGISVEQVIDSYTARGLVMNESKQHVSNESAIFLRNYYHVSYRRKGMMLGIYPTMRALGHLLFLERFHDPDKWGPKAVAMRQLSILENCRNHPLGEEFVRFVAKGDKFLLGKTLPGFLSHIDRVFAESKANDTLYVTWSARNDPRPPSKWWVTDIVKSL